MKWKDGADALADSRRLREEAENIRAMSRVLRAKALKVVQANRERDRIGEDGHAKRRDDATAE
jgi:hypothetical protein